MECGKQKKKKERKEKKIKTPAFDQKEKKCNRGENENAATYKYNNIV